jgi:hypothetical protein
MHRGIVCDLGDYQGGAFFYLGEREGVNVALAIRKVSKYFFGTIRLRIPDLHTWLVQS